MAVRIQREREEERVGRVEQAPAISSAIKSLDDLQFPGQTETRVTGQRFQSSSSKMNEANEFEAKMVVELRDLCRGVEEDFSRLGIQVKDAENFQGWEKFYSLVGAKDKAERLRLERINVADVKEAVLLITKHASGVVVKLGESEQELIFHIRSLEAKLTEVTKKLVDAQPRLKEANELREQYDAKLKQLKLELDASDENTRPVKQKEFEDAKRVLQRSQAKEAEFLEIVNEAVRDIDILQKARDGYLQTVIAVREMRRGLFEKMDNLLPLLDAAMAAVKVKARIESFRTIDPAFNKTIEVILENILKTAAAAVQIAIDRARKAPIDPKKSSELAQELLRTVEAWAKGIDELQKEAHTGHPADPEDGNTTNNLAAKAGNGNNETVDPEDGDIGPLKI